MKPSDKFRKLTKNPYFYEGTDECLFEGIKRFPAASLACFKDGVIRINKYWTPINGELNVPPDYGEQVEELSSLLKQSCKLRLRSDVPVATALSGGVDSSAVAASIALNGGSDKSGQKINQLLSPLFLVQSWMKPLLLARMQAFWAWK